MVGQKPSGFDLFVFAVDDKFAQNPHSEFDAFSVMQQKTMFEMGASRLARIQKIVDFDIILPKASVSLLADLRVLKRFHNFCIFTSRFFIFFASRI